MSSFTCRQTICAAHFSTATKPVATAVVKSLCSSTKINKVTTALKLNIHIILSVGMIVGTFDK